MNKKLSISILFLILTSIAVYGQQISFQKNVNSKANTLLQNLNNNEDSLLLESIDKPIQRVAIFSDNFESNFDVDSTKVKINLESLPTGAFIVQAKIDHKWIVMYLEKNTSKKVTSSITNEQYSKLMSGASHMHEDQVKTKTPKFYWVVSESNSNFGSVKSMKLEYKENIDKLISKNRLELKSNIGKENKLLVYTVYHKSKFMNKQTKNPNYYKSAEHSKFFDTEPFYSSNNEIRSESRP